MMEVDKDIYGDFQVAFYFKVDFIQMTVDVNKERKEIGRETVEFKEVSGLNREVETETLYEGGFNNVEYKLPKRVKYTNLTLKKALMKGDSELGNFFKQTIEGNFSIPFPKRDILVQLFNGKEIPTHLWRCENAYPVKWEISTLDSEKNELVIKHLEFAYQTLRRE